MLLNSSRLFIVFRFLYFVEHVPYLSAANFLVCMDISKQENVMWACPACAKKVDDSSSEAASTLKRKREHKDGKKRQKLGNSANAPAGPVAPSPKSLDGGASSFTIPKRKKERKLSSQLLESSRSTKEKRREQRAKEEKREEKRARVAVATAAAGEAETEAECSTTAMEAQSHGEKPNSSRMVREMKQTTIAPRVGLGLSDGPSPGLMMRTPDDVASSLSDDYKSSHKGTARMSFADAAASVAASTAATEAAAAAPVVSAPPKALGLKKLLHQRVQYDESAAATAHSFSPKNLLKHRLLAAHANNRQSRSNPVESRGGSIKAEVIAGNTGFRSDGASDTHRNHDWAPAQQDPVVVSKVSRDEARVTHGYNNGFAASADSRERPGERFDDVGHRGGGSGAGERGFGSGDHVYPGDVSAHGGVVKGGHFREGDGDELDRREHGMDTEDRLGERAVGPGHGLEASSESGWRDGKGRDSGTRQANFKSGHSHGERNSPSEGGGGRGGADDAARWSSAGAGERDAGREGSGFASCEQQRQRQRGQEVRVKG